MKTFSADSICLNYQGGARAIRQFELNFTGKTLAVFGGECAGKTSLIKSIAGLESYDGSFYLNNKLLKVAPSQQNIFALFDDYCLILNKTVFYNLILPLKLRKVDSIRAENLVNEALKQFGIEQYKNTKVKKLNAKLKALVGMAKIELREADLYLFDDILRVFSTDEKEGHLKRLKSTFSNLNGLIVYATSSFAEAVALADKIVILRGGVIEQYGTFDEISNSPSSVYVAEIVSGGKTVFEYSLLNKNNQNLIVSYNNQQIILENEYSNKLISDIYINSEVLVGEYINKGVKKYLIMDTETEKSILK